MRRQGWVEVSVSRQGGSLVALAPAIPAFQPPAHRWAVTTHRAHRIARRAATHLLAEVVEDGGIRFVLRVAARLRDKPKPPADGVTAGDNGRKKEWRNPFLPYEQALWVADLGGEWALRVGPALQLQVRLRLQPAYLIHMHVTSLNQPPNLDLPF